VPRSTSELGDLLIDCMGRTVEGLVERDPKADPQEGHDQDSDG